MIRCTKCLPPRLAGQPVGLLLVAAGQDRLVHQVVAEDRRAVLAHPRDGLPEAGLDVPPVGLLQARRTTRARPACGSSRARSRRGTGRSPRPAARACRSRARFASSGRSAASMNLASWRWTRTTFAPRRLHLPEVLDDRRPLVVPVVLQQAAGVVVIVVDPPDHDPLARPLARRSASRPGSAGSNRAGGRAPGDRPEAPLPIGRPSRGGTRRGYRGGRLIERWNSWAFSTPMPV